MPEIIFCNDCEKTFDNDIKLQKHREQHVMDSMIDFLNSDKEWMDHEKVKYLDTLKRKLLNIEEKVKEYENQYFELEEKLNILHPQRKVNQPTLNVKRKRKRKGKYEDITDNHILPPGWKSAISKKSVPLGGQVGMTVFWAPDGKFCANLRHALHYLLNVLNGKKEDIDQLKSGLQLAGWNTAKYLPQGWMVKQKDKNKKHGLNYITPDFKFCNSKMKALKFLMNHNSNSEEMSCFIINVFLNNEMFTESITWLDSPHIPKGWKVGSATSVKEKETKIILTREGVVISKKGTFKRRLSNMPELSKLELTNFLSFLKIEQEDVDIEEKANIGIEEDELKPKKRSASWFPAEKMPEGWKGCLQNGMFKDPTGQIFRSRHEAWKYLKQAGGDEKDLSLVKYGLHSDGWSEEDYLPLGWMVKSVIQKRYKRTEFMTNHMDYFDNLKKAIIHMKENRFTSQEIHRMKGPDWTQVTDLPEGWSFKFYKKTTKVYMNEDGQYFNSLPLVLKHMSASNHPVKDQEMAKTALINKGWSESAFLPPGWMYKIINYRSGILFLTAEYKTLHAKYEAEKAIAKIGKKYLHVFKENWENLMDRGNREYPTKIEDNHKSTPQWQDDQTLPPGWKINGKNNTSLLHSSSGKIFLAREQAYAFMVTDGACTEEDVDKMRNSFLELGWEFKEFLPK